MQPCAGKSLGRREGETVVEGAQRRRLEDRLPVLHDRHETQQEHHLWQGKQDYSCFIDKQIRILY